MVVSGEAASPAARLSSKPATDAGLVHAGPRSSREAATAPRRRRGERLIAPLAVALVPLALDLTIGLAA